MKKLVAIGLSSVIAGSLFAGPALAGKAKPQTVSGMIVAPAPFATDPTQCFAGLQRRAAIVSSEQQQGDGVVGYFFNVDPATVGKPFNVTATSPVGGADVDITFYTKFGTTDDVTGDPQNAGSPPTVDFATRSTTGEHGMVPKGYPKAIVCLWSGDSNQSAGANFTYTAGPGVKPTK